MEIWRLENVLGLSLIFVATMGLLDSILFYCGFSVRCGHCASLLSINIGGLQHTLLFVDLQYLNHNSEAYGSDYASSSECSRILVLDSSANVKTQIFNVNLDAFRLTSHRRFTKW